MPLRLCRVCSGNFLDFHRLSQGSRSCRHLELYFCRVRDRVIWNWDCSLSLSRILQHSDIEVSWRNSQNQSEKIRFRWWEESLKRISVRSEWWLDTENSTNKLTNIQSPEENTNYLVFNAAELDFGLGLAANTFEVFRERRAVNGNSQAGTDWNMIVISLRNPPYRSTRLRAS